MSKIEEALRLAKERRIDDFQGRHYRDAEFVSPPRDQKVRRLTNPPAVYDLNPSVRYDLDYSVLKKNRVLNDDYPDAARTAYKMLRTRTVQKMRSDAWRILAITSPMDGAGKTLTAVNLAIALASHGDHDVFLFDLDLGNPNVAEYLGLPKDGKGIGDYLTGRAAFSSVACDVGIENLTVVPGYERHLNSSELIASKSMVDLFANIVTSIPDPMLIVDLPPVLTADDALAISPIIDGFLMVVSESETVRDDISKSFDILRDSNIFGVVHNKAH